MKRIGIDIGSLYVGGVIVEGDCIQGARYVEHGGDIRGAVESILDLPAYRQFDTLGITGPAPGPGAEVIDSFLALIEGARFLLPGCRNVFAIGGQSFALIFYDERGAYREHSVNPPCAAGTGSFIEQQAERLGLDAAGLAERAFSCRGKVPAIATRCAVFAKTDIIHAMQEGYSLEGICAGLCEGIARNVADALVKGRELLEPVGLIGGVSLNRAIARSLEKSLDRRVKVPRWAEVAGAVGAALLGRLEAFHPGLIEWRGREQRTRPALAMRLSRYPDFSAQDIRVREGVEILLPAPGPAEGGSVTEGSSVAKGDPAAKDDPVAEGGPAATDSPAAAVARGAWLGLDIGSTSTKAALVGTDRRILGGFYTATSGRPIEAVRRLLKAIEETFAGLPILGAATTGSGRQIVRELFRADLAVNEISAHARAAVHLHPQVDTIIEIGGQDSKLTLLRDGEVYFSTMNYVCAAGTGSFIEEQARRLEVSLQDFSELAFGARAPYTSDRCTVYMERDLNVLLADGWSREALAAAVLNSVRDNYLAKVVNRTPLGRHIVFQGATARNRALVAAFEQLLEQPLHVSPYCHLTGALGAALLGLERSGNGAAAAASPFIREMEGFEITEETCRRCANHCLLTVAEVHGRKSGWGMKCGEEYDRRRPAEIHPSAPERRFEQLFAAPAPGPALERPQGPVRPREADRAAVRIGIPRALYHVGYAPLWCGFLRRLGFSVELSDSRRETLLEAKGLVNSDFCAPMVLAHGAVAQLLERGCDYLFAPAVVNERDPGFDGERLFKRKTRDAYFCYYSQYLPTIVGKLTAVQAEDRLIAPLLYFNHRSLEENAAEIHRALAAKLPARLLGGEEETREALLAAWAELQRRRESWLTRPGRESGGRPQVLLLGRPYVIFDPVMNLGLPALLEQEGADLFWQEEIDLEDFQPVYATRYFERMHWHYGRQILKAAEYCARQPNLFAVYLTCFRCSPDSFLLSYVKDIMRRYGKPFLILQLDEHGSSVGYATRIEAALESFRNYLRAGRAPASPSRSRARNDALREGDIVLMPQVDPVVSAFWSASFRHEGFETRLLDPDEKSLNTGCQYTSGGECLPLVSLIGGVIEKVRGENLDPARCFFYLPTLCMACNFPNFPILADLAFESAGLDGLRIGLINMMAPGEILPQSLSLRIMESNIVGGILTKLFHRVAPYEIRRGDSEAAFRGGREAVNAALLAGGDLRAALAEAVARFEAVARDESGGRRPRIGLLGDLYVKFNDLVNGRVQDLVRELGGELVVPSWTEYAFHFYDADVRLYGDDPRHFRLLRTIEKRYEKLAGPLLEGQEEPDFAECVRCLQEYGIAHYLTGETSINVGRALYLIRTGRVEALLHVNPMFCCPGVVSSSIYRKVQRDFGVPIIDIFYDGVGHPNRVLIPHLHYLNRSAGRASPGTPPRFSP